MPSLVAAEGEVCYANVRDLPATCSAGEITLDEWNGCRSLICEDGEDAFLQVLSCNKPDGQEPQYFEMYKQGSSGQQLELCLGETCISSNGYARSPDYPICLDADDPTPVSCETLSAVMNVNPDGSGFIGCDSIITGDFNLEGSYCEGRYSGVREYLVPDAYGREDQYYAILGGLIPTEPVDVFVEAENGSLVECAPTLNTPLCGNGIVETNEQCDDNNSISGDGCSSTCELEEDSPGICVSSIADVPVSCEGGELVTDVVSGCRTIECSGDTGSVQVLACDKPSPNDPTHFEVYRQQSSGYGVDVCFGDECMQGWGFKSFDYPFCSEPDVDVQGLAVVSLVDSPIAVDHNVLVTCETDFVPTEFVWDFGDGITRVKNADTVLEEDYWEYFYHTYTENGTYEITCNASNENESATGSTIVTIETEATPEEIEATLPVEWSDPTFNGIYNPWVFRPIAEQIDGSKFRVGGYAVGLSRNEDNSGQIGFWLSFLVASQFTSTHDNVYEITFAEPATYDINIDAGDYPTISGVIEAPELYTRGTSGRGCSNPRAVCLNARGDLVFTVPDIGTRDFFGVEIERLSEDTYRFRVANYAADEGLAFYVGGYEYDSGEWITRTFDNIDNGPRSIDFYQYLVPNGMLRARYVAEVYFNESYCGDAVVDTGEQCDDGNQQDGDGCSAICELESSEPEYSVELSIADWYPQGTHYVFNCIEEGFEAESYSWSFGDGIIQSTSQNNVYHVYGAPGDYEVTCDAIGTISATDSLEISVTN